MSALFKFINDTSRYVGIYKQGFRLISNTGNDAGQYPKNIMNIMIAGGNTLGVTVTNIYGNQKIWQKLPHPYDFADLSEYPHEHCLANHYDIFKAMKILKIFP